MCKNAEWPPWRGGEQEGGRDNGSDFPLAGRDPQRARPTFQKHEGQQGFVLKHCLPRPDLLY